MSDGDLRREWIKKVLGIDLPAAIAADPAVAGPRASNLIPTLDLMRLAITKCAGPNEDALAEIAGKIATLIAAGDLAAAERMMDELSKGILAAQEGKDARDLQSKLDRERKRIDAAGLVGAVLRELTALADATQTAIDAGDAKKAKVALRKLIGELDSLAPETMEAGTSDDGSADVGVVSDEDELSSRLDDLAVQASLLPNPARGNLTRQLERIRTNPDSRSLDEFEATLALASRSARMAEVKLETGNAVTVRKLQKQWIAAEDDAQKALAQFVDALVNDQDLQGDERFADLPQQARALAELLPNDGGKLMMALGDFDDADGSSRGKALTAAQSALSDYRSHLQGVPGMDTLESIATEEYGIPPFFDALQTSLSDLDRALA